MDSDFIAILDHTVIDKTNTLFVYLFKSLNNDHPFCNFNHALLFL